MQNFDLVVIGSGPGGYPAAIRAAQLGANVAIIEREFIGGTCLNWGCIPTKTLIASAELIHRIRNADAVGIHVENVSFDYEELCKRKDDVITKLRSNVQKLLDGHGVTTFGGVGSFTSPHTISIAGNGNTIEIHTENTIIATGSISFMPDFLPKSDRIIESRGFLNLTELPKSMMILGGGVIGCELASMIAPLGVDVKLIEVEQDVLKRLDSDLRRHIKRVMKNDFDIDMLVGESFGNVTVNGKGVSATFGDKEISADMLLASVGRRPVTDTLNLENSGVKISDRGYILVNQYCETDTPSIYAIGDVIGGPQLAHTATSQGITASENACTDEKIEMQRFVPACIFTIPGIGIVGMSEIEAKEQGRKIKVGKFMFGALGKAYAEGESNGFVKWIVDAETDKLIGAGAIGPYATVMISEAALAIRNELTASEVGDTIHCHPTFSEAWMEAARNIHGISVHAAPARN